MKQIWKIRFCFTFLKTSADSIADAKCAGSSTIEIISIEEPNRAKIKRVRDISIVPLINGNMRFVFISFSTYSLLAPIVA